MTAEQGQTYRIVTPVVGGHRFGQSPPERFVHRFTAAGEPALVVEDVIGDVVYASENVDYPRGPQKQHRHVRWIEEHPERFELIDE